jgi:SPP1 gp7 family putative phage head morphogenesis protein
MEPVKAEAVRYNDAPLSASTTDNWVARRGGLPPMVRAIVRALERNGHSESSAIAVAIGAVKRWAAGGGNVHPSTRARAAAAVAHWESIKGHRAIEDLEEAIRAAGQPASAGSAYSAGHPFYGNQHVTVGSSIATGQFKGRTGGNYKGGKPTTGTGGAAKGGTGKAAKGGAAKSGASSAAASLAAKQTALANAVDSAQKAYDNAHLSAQTAQDNLTAAQKQIAQDTAFAQARDKAAHNAETNTAKGLTGTAAATAADQNVQAVSLSTQSRLASAQHAADAANLHLQQAQESLLKAMKAAGFREDDEDLAVRDWKKWHLEHPYQRHGRLREAERAHTNALKASGKVLSGGEVTQTKWRQAIEGHTTAARHFRSLADAHLAAHEHAHSIAASRVATAHEAAASEMRRAANDKTLTSYENQAIERFRQRAADMLGEYHAVAYDTAVRVGEWGAAGPPTLDASGAGNLLPVGPTKKQADDINEELEEADKHRHVGGNLSECASCGRPITDAVHAVASTRGLPSEAPSVRHRGTDHESVPSGHVKGIPARHRQAVKARTMRHFGTIETPLTDSLQKLFEDQRRSTVNRLLGKRGGQTLKRAAEAIRAAEDDDAAPPPTDEEIGGAAAVDPAGVFDTAYWTGKTADVIEPHLSHAATLATHEVAHQLGLGSAGAEGHAPTPADFDAVWPGGDEAKVQAVVAARAANAAHYVTTTTADELAQALHDGVAAGEGRDAIAKRVNDVFDNANMTRAKLIAQTETVGAYNEAQHQYAATLPPEVVGTHVWLSHEDQRTRPHHRVANGQERPMTAPFHVGDSTLMYPGDKDAPIGEWINCRCSQAFMPPGMTYAPMAAAAQAYVDAMRPSAPKVESPYKVDASTGSKNG